MTSSLPFYLWLGRGSDQYGCVVAEHVYVCVDDTEQCRGAPRLKACHRSGDVGMGATVIRRPHAHFLNRSPKFITLDRNPLGNGPMEIISPLLHQTCIGLFVFLLLLAGWTDLTIPNQLPVALFVLVIPFGMTSQGGPSSNGFDLNTLIEMLWTTKV
jgi:hypothetical protein